MTATWPRGATLRPLSTWPGPRTATPSLDGLPRANARMVDEGVILDLGKSKHGPLRYPCDRFTSWQDNVRAIALALEALRKVDRYGVTSHGEQYAGWRAIGTGPTAMPAAMSQGEATRYLADLVGRSGDALTIPSSQLVRLARRRAHPDTGGDPAVWNRVQAAAVVLGVS